MECILRLSFFISFCFSLLLTFTALANDQAKQDCLTQVQQKNWDKAIIECTAASEQGSAASAAILGRIYEKGLGDHKNLEKAAEWYDYAAHHNSANAAYRLAELWLTPDSGLGYEPEKAAIYLELAYQNGHVKAGLAFARMLRDGRYIPQNPAAAFRVYENLSTKSRMAAYQTGKMLMAGQGTDKDEKRAVKYYKVAANANLTDAQRDLGLAYWEGSGVEQSNEQAWKWLDIAAFKGDMEAAAKLNELGAQIADVTAQKGRKDARAWLAENTGATNKQ